jgi:hypothetical protein
LAIEDLERYISTADIESTLAWPLRGAHPSYMLVLVGGVSVLAKPADEAPSGAGMSKHETAGWVLARELGWYDLIAVTVMREIPSRKNVGTNTAASLQVIWPANDKGPALTALTKEDIIRAAILDMLMVHGDRHNQNYLAVPPTGSGVQPRLKLVDHGYAFTANDTGSPFYQAVRGQPLEEPYFSRLQGLDPNRLKTALDGLLEPGELTALLDRLRHLVTTRRCDLS